MPSGQVARRDELLDELVALFTAEGFRRFTVADLATRLRCSKTTLYLAGHSKEQITVNATARFFQQATAEVERATGAHDAPAARLAAYLHAVATALRRASPRFMGDLTEHPATRLVYERNTQLASQRVRELIAEGAADGTFRSVDAAFAAETIVAAMTRIQAGEIARTTGLDDADAYDALADLALNGLAR